MKTTFFFFIFYFLINGLFAQINNDSVYSESEAILNTPTGDIYGTLTVANETAIIPLVLIIAGSGPTDRNGNSAIGLKSDTYKMLAKELAKNGVSTLRFDKRGIGKSTSAMTAESELRFDTYINDVVDWISLLKADERFSSISILGHSEGSLIGMMAACKTDIAKFISIAGSGKSADKILQEQLQTKLPPQLLVESNRILDSLKTGKTVADVNPILMALYRPSVQPYMISWIRLDPSKEISRLKIPVLIIQGSTDLQVPVDNAYLLLSSRPESKLLIIENMNHIMKESESDQQKNFATYNNPDLPLKSGLVDEIILFMKLDK